MDNLQEFANKITLVRPTDLYELLQEIKKRPLFFLARYSILNFQSFLDGYDFARRQLNIPRSEQEQELDFFVEWIREKYEIKTSQSWASILLFYSRDEKEALDNFFELFEEFCQEKSHENLFK